MATLIEMGEPKPAEHLYLAANGRLSTLILGRAPLSMRDLNTLDETVQSLHYKTLAAPNRVSADTVIGRILRWFGFSNAAAEYRLSEGRRSIVYGPRAPGGFKSLMRRVNWGRGIRHHFIERYIRRLA